MTVSTISRSVRPCRRVTVQTSPLLPRRRSGVSPSVLKHYCWRAGTVCCSSVDAFFQVRKTDQAGPSLWTRKHSRVECPAKDAECWRKGHTVQFASRNPFQVCNKKTTIVFRTTHSWMRSHNERRRAGHPGLSEHYVKLSASSLAQSIRVYFQLVLPEHQQVDHAVALWHCRVSLLSVSITVASSLEWGFGLGSKKPRNSEIWFCRCSFADFRLCNSVIWFFFGLTLELAM